MPAPPRFQHTEVLPLRPDGTGYRRLDLPPGTTVEVAGRTFLQVDPATLTALVRTAVHDIQHLLRPSHLAQLRAIVDDPEASPNDRFVATDLLRNACVAAGGVLPMCQDTGTAIVVGKRTETVLTGGDDERAISQGIFEAYAELNLRYSQMAPTSFWDERNTGTNLPAQVELYAAPGTEPRYELLVLAKGGGSANKTFLYQETKALLQPRRLAAFLEEKLRGLGTAACPPYHLAIVVGGLSAEMTLKVAKLASARYLDTLPAQGSELGHAFRDHDLEKQVLELTRGFGIGAQFGGKYFCHDVRVVRLPRHGASLPVGIAVSCSADRQARAKITPDGVFLEQLERDPARFLPDVTPEQLAADAASEVVQVDLRRPMAQIRAQLSTLPVRTRVALTGPLVVARDIAHAKIAERLDAGEEMPGYLRDHPVYYAGPAKTPAGYASGSFGPTTAGRMDSYVAQFQAAGGSLVMLAKGNRSAQVTESCAAQGGFYHGSIGGPAARLAQDSIRSVEVLD
ncbi:MAG: fumarate hydratase, partial [Pseudonocardia sp.]